MTDIITREITRKQESVTIAGRECRLSYPMHNVFAFKAQTRQSLFARNTWDLLDFEANYDAWMACLWSGMHELQPDGSWKAPFTRPELELLIDIGNGTEVHNAMFRALTNWMPQKKQLDDEAGAKEKKTTPAVMDTMTPETTSPGSGFAPNGDSVLVGQNS